VEVLDCPREVVEEVESPPIDRGPGDRARLGGYRLVRVGPERAGGHDKRWGAWERPLKEDALSRAEEAREAVEPRPGRYKAPSAANDADASGPVRACGSACWASSASSRWSIRTACRKGGGVPAVLSGVPAGVGGSEFEWEAFRLPVGGHQAGRPGAIEEVIQRVLSRSSDWAYRDSARETLKTLQRAGHLRRSPDS